MHPSTIQEQGHLRRTPIDSQHPEHLKYRPDPNGTNLSPNGALSHSPGQAPALPWVLVGRSICPVGAASKTTLNLAPFRPDPIGCFIGCFSTRQPLLPAMPTHDALTGFRKSCTSGKTGSLTHGAGFTRCFQSLNEGRLKKKPEKTAA
jgi:hypothetical protein